MGNYTYRLSLWIQHPDADLSDIPKKLGLTAHRLWKKGDRRITPKGRDTGSIQKKSYCNIGFNDTPPAGLPEGIRAALDLLKPHKNYLIKLADGGVELQFFVGWYSERNSREILDWALLKEMAELRISLDLDVYGPDPAEVAPGGISPIEG